MDDGLGQIWREIVERPDGPMALRFYLQPLMASLLAVRDGLKDARLGKPPYLWAVLTEPARRAELIRDGWRSVGKIFLIALVLDLVYQFLVLRGWQPGVGALVAVTLAIIPYALLRGPVNRIARTRRRGPAARPAA